MKKIFSNRLLSILVIIFVLSTLGIMVSAYIKKFSSNEISVLKDCGEENRFNFQMSDQSHSFCYPKNWVVEESYIEDGKAFNIVNQETNNVISLYTYSTDAGFTFEERKDLEATSSNPQFKIESQEVIDNTATDFFMKYTYKVYQNSNDVNTSYLLLKRDAVDSEYLIELTHTLDSNSVDYLEQNLYTLISIGNSFM